jgi:hypothetical protein
MSAMSRNNHLVGFLVLLVMGIVLLPLRAVAATIPHLFAYDAAVRPTTTTVLGGGRLFRWGKCGYWTERSRETRSTVQFAMGSES